MAVSSLAYILVGVNILNCGKASRRLVPLDILLSGLDISCTVGSLLRLLGRWLLFRDQSWRLLILLGKCSGCIVSRLSEPVMDDDLCNLLVRVVSFLLLHLLLDGCNLVNHTGVVREARIVICISS